MGRRTVLLIVAALIAALGAGMVFLYVRGADSRAEAGQSPVQVLKAVAQIDPGETMAAAQAAGKIQLGTVPRAQVLAGAVNSASGLEDKVALSTIYPKEQIITAKFGSPGEQSVLTIPDGDIAISLNLSDTGRVAGFVSPGRQRGHLRSRHQGRRRSRRTPPGCCCRRSQVIAVGSTTVVSTTKTDPDGRADHRAAPQDAVHARGEPGRGAEGRLRRQPRRAHLRRCSTTRPTVKADRGRRPQNLFR